MPFKPSSFRQGLVALLVMAGASLAHATSPAEQLAAYRASTGATAGVAERGQALFSKPHGRDWSCASCHGELPVQSGKHAVTGKAIGPLAPAFNPERFVDAEKTEKWFRRNCKDVMGRECTVTEKADVLAWLMTLKK